MSRSKSSLAEAKREHLLDKVSATPTRTAEVTICIVPERLPDRPRKLPHASIWGRAAKQLGSGLKISPTPTAENHTRRLKGKEKRSGVFLAYMSTHGACNEVWWTLPNQPTTTSPNLTTGVRLYVCVNVFWMGDVSTHLG